MTEAQAERLIALLGVIAHTLVDQANYTYDSHAAALHDQIEAALEG